MQFNANYIPNDPLKLDFSLTEDEKQIKNMLSDFAHQHLKPYVTEAFRNESLFIESTQKIGTLKIYGGEIAKRYGGKDINAVSYGLIARELERIDSGYRTLYSVMGSLVMQAIDAFGTEKQKQTYLPKLLKAEIIGAFALTEPDHGSDTGDLETVVTQTKNGYLLNGTKKWIGLAPFADIFIVWAKDHLSGELKGLIVPRKTTGIITNKIEGKISLRTVPQGEIYFNNVEISESCLLPKAKGFSAPFSCLNHARYGIAWGALGAAENCLEIALNYTKSRSAFGSKLAAKQLIQKKLVDMQIEIATSLQACLQVGRLIDQGEANHHMISILKLNSVRKALQIARQARDILGANGIIDDYDIMRHLVNLESVVTYEGTEDIHALILGKALTGHAAF
jgi:glutaryl-CoA dehydrogenase